MACVPLVNHHYDNNCADNCLILFVPWFVLGLFFCQLSPSQLRSVPRLHLSTPPSSLSPSLPFSLSPASCLLPLPLLFRSAPLLFPSLPVPLSLPFAPCSRAPASAVAAAAAQPW